MTRSIVLLATLALVIVSSASAAKLPANRYWTTVQANAAVIAQARVGTCTPAGCPFGRPRADFAGVTYPVMTASCSGMSGFAAGGGYARFICSFAAINDMTSGRLEVRTAGATTIRWKRI